jgi:lysophospholipase L1-like esterase
LLIGINDIWNNGSPSIPPPEYIGKNINNIVKFIKDSSPKTKIYVQTILPIEKEIFKESIKKVNQIIKSNELNKKYEVIDLYSLFANENGLMIKELSTDGIHLNEKGYQKWVEFIKPIVYSLE